MKQSTYNDLIQRIHDHAAMLETKQRSKKELEFFIGYACALFDHGILTDGQYCTARDYAETCKRRKVNDLIIPFNAC